MLRRIAELVYHHSTTTQRILVDGFTPFLGRLRRRLSLSSEARATSPHDSLDALAATAGSAMPARTLRRMRVKDDLKLEPQAASATVLYLSPHYKLLSASGTARAPGQSGNLELSSTSRLYPYIGPNNHRSRRAAYGWHLRHVPHDV